MHQPRLPLRTNLFTRRSRVAESSINHLFLRLCLYLAAPLILLWGIAPQPTATFLWDWANAVGYLAAALLILLFLYRGQPQPVPAFNGRFFINLHRDLGYLALIFTAIHIGVLLIDEPLLIEHLKPTAPWYMLSGLVAAILLLALVFSSLPNLRKEIWPDYRIFRQRHLLISLGVILFLFIHLLGSRYYINSLWKQLLLILTGCSVLVHYGINRKQPKYYGSKEMPRERGNTSASVMLSFGISLVMLIASLLLVLLTGVLTANE